MTSNRLLLNPSQSSIPTWTLLAVASVMLGTTLTLVASWWILAWTGLVLNLLSVCPIMPLPKKAGATESTMKYFILQSIAATTMLMTILLSQNLSLQIIPLMLTAALTLKLGIPPFHFWVPQVFSTLPWPTILLLSTWQKIGPLAFMMASLNILSSWSLTTISLLAMLTGSLGAWTSSNLKTLIAYSSINHTGWMILLLCLSPQMMALYFLLYSIQMISLTLFVMLLAPSQNSLLLAPQKLSTFQLLLALIFVSMSGIPPFIGFIPKLMLLISTAATPSAIITISVMILSSLIITSTYLSIALNSIPLKLSNLPMQNASKLTLLTIFLTLPILLMSPISLIVM